MRLAILAAIALAIPPGTASAHAMLTSATPAVGSTVATAPTEVTAQFSEGVEPGFSRMIVQDAAGQRVDADDLHLAPGGDRTLVVGLRKLPAGVYKVIWHVVSVDTHKTQGSFSFSVGQ